MEKSEGVKCKSIQTLEFIKQLNVREMIDLSLKNSLVWSRLETEKRDGSKMRLQLLLRRFLPPIHGLHLRLPSLFNLSMGR